MSGYSGTPLAKKLGIVAGSHVLVVSAPAHYRRLLAPVPPGVTFASKGDAAIDPAVDLVHIFTANRSELKTFLTKARRAIRPDAALWVSWPKKTSKVPTDVTEDTIRELALPIGFVDVKVCAVDDVWSGLKLVIRKEYR
jgi:hypothetical protein